MSPFPQILGAYNVVGTIHPSLKEVTEYNWYSAVSFFGDTQLSASLETALAEYRDLGQTQVS